MTCDIYYYLTIELDHAKRDSRLTAYGGVVLQRLEGLFGNATVSPVKSILLIFVNKIYLPCCCVVLFVVCQLLRPI